MLSLQIITPEGIFFKGEVKRIIVRAMEGDLAILKDRIPITTPIRAGRAKILSKEERIAELDEGYISLLNNKATIITEKAKWINK